MKTVNVPGRLHSVAVGNVLTGANEIYDDRIRKNQAVINDEVKNNITNILNDITDLQEERLRPSLLIELTSLIGLTK